VYSCIRVTDKAEIVEVTFHGLNLDINCTNFIQISRNRKFDRHYIKKVLLDFYCE